MKHGKLNFRIHTDSKPLADIGIICKKAPIKDTMFRGKIKCIPCNKIGTDNIQAYNPYTY
jgi:hypothetical protein